MQQSATLLYFPAPKDARIGGKRLSVFLQSDLDKHLKKDCPNRDYSCEHCREKGTYTSITKSHDKVCPKKPIHCPKRCSITVQRQRVEEHLATECELTVIACKYKRLGCDRELKRKDMATHEEDDKLHLRMAMDTTVKLETETLDLRSKLEAVLKRGESLNFKLTHYHKIKDGNDIVYSPPYYTSPNGYRMALGVYANGDGPAKGTHVSVFAPILKGKYDAQLKWPFTGNVTFTLLNQLEDKNHHQDIMEQTAEQNAQAGGTIWGYSQFIRHSALDYDAVNNTQYLKDDTLYFRMSVEPADQDKPWLQ